jgi:single-strand DNA-binding protein
MNKVIIVGRLTKDPELKYTPNGGTAICRITVAVNRQFKKDEADFINCVAFGKTGETIAQYFAKGRQIALAGNIRTGSYDGQDGVKRYTTDVIVESFEFIGNSNNGNVNTNNQNNDYWNMSTDNGFGVEEPIDDGDMPF